MTLHSVVSPALWLGNFGRSPMVQVSLVHVRDGTLSEKMRMTNHLQMLRAKAAHSTHLEIDITYAERTAFFLQ